MYQSMPLTRFPNGRHGYSSQALGIHLCLKGSELRLFDPATARDLRTYEEAERAAEEAQREVAELRARIRDLTEK